jgi:hypothetical protein
MNATEYMVDILVGRERRFGATRVPHVCRDFILIDIKTPTIQVINNCFGSKLIYPYGEVININVS